MTNLRVLRVFKDFKVLMNWTRRRGGWSKRNKRKTVIIYIVPVLIERGGKGDESASDAHLWYSITHGDSQASYDLRASVQRCQI